jgi:hypothetical protein
MKFSEIPKDTPDDQFVFIECDITGKTKKTRYGAAKQNVARNNGQYITNWGLTKLNNPMKNKEVKEKIKKTNLERYGNELAMNSQENIEKRKEQFKDKEFVKQRSEKSKKTCQEKYGVEHHMKSEAVQEKQKKVMQEKYGVDHPLQNKEILEKMQNTVKERYGIENVAQVPEVRVKMAQTTLERYGVQHYNQLPEMKDYLRQNCKEWLTESYANPWAKGIMRPEEWNQKQSATMAAKIVSGKFNPEDSRFYVTGYFKSKKCKKQKAFFRSSLELRTHYLLHHDDDVIWYENEPFAIPYESAKGIRHYIPDFFVVRKSKRPDLLEIKPAFRMREEQVQYKIEIAQNYSKENNCDFSYLDEKYLKNQVPLSIDELKALEFVEIIKLI